jgi:hypothetical protein
MACSGRMHSQCSRDGEAVESTFRWIAHNHEFSQNRMNQDRGWREFRRIDNDLKDISPVPGCMPGATRGRV